MLHMYEVPMDFLTLFIVGLIAGLLANRSVAASATGS